MHRHFFGHHERFSRHGIGGHMREHMGRGRHRGGRIGRFLEHGDLRFVILALVAEKPSHGYELIRGLEERTGGAYRPSPGVIYPTLSLLEDEGFVRQSGGESGRKLYEITPAGQDALAGNRASVDAVFERMGEAAASSAMSSAKVLRAMENLKTALRLRLSQGPISEAQIEAVAAAIDRAASEVERA
jgi:DNA-binding PadR family transcriptional regulator